MRSVSILFSEAKGSLLRTRYHILQCFLLCADKAAKEDSRNGVIFLAAKKGNLSRVYILIYKVAMSCIRNLIRNIRVYMLQVKIKFKLEVFNLG